MNQEEIKQKANDIHNEMKTFIGRLNYDKYDLVEAINQNFRETKNARGEVDNRYSKFRKDYEALIHIAAKAFVAHNEENFPIAEYLFNNLTLRKPTNIGEYILYCLDYYQDNFKPVVSF